MTSFTLGTMSRRVRRSTHTSPSRLAGLLQAHWRKEPPCHASSMPPADGPYRSLHSVVLPTFPSHWATFPSAQRVAILIHCSLRSSSHWHPGASPAPVADCRNERRVGGAECTQLWRRSTSLTVKWR